MALLAKFVPQGSSLGTFVEAAVVLILEQPTFHPKTKLESWPLRKEAILLYSLGKSELESHL